MQVKGFVNQVGVMVLIDSGSTHNFLNPYGANKTSLVVQNIARLKVVVVNIDLVPS